MLSLFADPNLWAKLHGGSTHFPIALVLTSMLLDGAALVISDPVKKSGLNAAGFYTLIIAAMGTFPAVISGLIMSKWNAMGTGAVRMHHLFVWPSFALIIGLATWRVLVRNQASRKGFGIYFAMIVITAGLIATAGYWGGEMLING